MWVNFLTCLSPELKDTEHRLLTLLYVLFWNTAAALAMFSTIMSILLMLYINQTANNVEAKHFIEEFDNSTWKLGSMSPVLFLYLSSLFAGLGTIDFILLRYDFTWASYIAIMLLGTVVFIFGYLMLKATSSLFASRRVQKVIGSRPKLYLGIEIIQKLMHSYVKLDKYPRVDEFLKGTDVPEWDKTR